jgi:truncated hemoglobin YjbI
MRLPWISSVVLVASALVLGQACSSSSGAAASADSGVKADALYQKLGAGAGIRKVVDDFLARVTADPKINGYFLNGGVDAKHLGDCLVAQVGSVTGGPEKYTCKGMKAAHAGLGISKQDFDDLVGHLSDALVAAKVAQADIDTVLGVLGPMSKDIVEDTTNDADIYQRVGRKPAIQQVVTDFHANVMADARINAFFAKADGTRLATCLVRQVCEATGGPCKYGKEIPEAEPGVKSACRSMLDAHSGLGIAKADFDALAGDLVAALDADGVSTADRDAIVGVLGPMCKDIVEKDPSACP